MNFLIHLHAFMYLIDLTGRVHPAFLFAAIGYAAYWFVYSEPLDRMG